VRMGTTVRSVLRERGFELSERDVARALGELLPRVPAGNVAVPGDEAAFLATHSGVTPASEAQLLELDARSVARAAAEAAQSLSRGQIAHRLGLDPSRISHMTSDGALFAYRGGPGRLLYPDWQLHGRSLLPHLKLVLRSVPVGSHPVAVRRFMTTPDDDLTLSGQPQSPRDWLVGGGDPASVAALAGTLGEQE